MSRGLGLIERAILAMIEDKDAGKSAYAAETLSVAVYQPRKGPKGLPTQVERVAVDVPRTRLCTSISTGLC